MSKFFDELMESVKQADEILRREHGSSSSKPAPKMPLELHQKQAYYDKVRRSNYLASLRIEGYKTTRDDADKPLATREEVLNKYLRSAPLPDSDEGK